MEGFGRGREESGTALYGPGQRDLCRRSVNAPCNAGDDEVFQKFRKHAVSRRRKRQQYDPMLPAKIEQLPFRQIGMGFDLHDCRLDPRRRNNLLQLLQGHVGQTNGPAAALVDEALKRSPGIDETHFGIVDDVTVLVPRVLLVARTKGKRCMDEIAIDLVELQPPAAGIKSWPDPPGR